MNFRMITLALFFIVINCFELKAQNIFEQRIWEVGGRKKSVFLDQGIFHTGKREGKSVLSAVRHSYVTRNGFERVVFDFNTNEIPQVYGHANSKEKKVYVDFFNTRANPSLSSFGNSKFVKQLNFFPIDENMLSVELDLKEEVLVDVFYLKNPGRLVIDIKK